MGARSGRMAPASRDVAEQGRRLDRHVCSSLGHVPSTFLFAARAGFLAVGSDRPVSGVIPHCSLDLASGGPPARRRPARSRDAPGLPASQTSSNRSPARRRRAARGSAWPGCHRSDTGFAGCSGRAPGRAARIGGCDGLPACRALDCRTRRNRGWLSGGAPGRCARSGRAGIAARSVL